LIRCATISVRFGAPLDATDPCAATALVRMRVLDLAASDPHVGLRAFVVASAQARGARILTTGLLLTAGVTCAHGWKHPYHAYLAPLVIVFVTVITLIVVAWS
jgi:hypothetical protein